MATELRAYEVITKDGIRHQGKHCGEGSIIELSSKQIELVNGTGERVKVIELEIFDPVAERSYPDSVAEQSYPDSLLDPYLTIPQAEELIAQCGDLAVLQTWLEEESTNPKGREGLVKVLTEVIKARTQALQQ